MKIVLAKSDHSTPITIEKGEGKLKITCDYLDQKILLEKSDYSTNITVEKGFLSVGGGQSMQKVFVLPILL